MVKAGIYLIINIKNDKVYVGSSKDLKSRKYKHFRDLKTNSHINSHLQYSYNKYGKTSFEWKVLEHIDRTNIKNNELGNILIDREQYYLDLYESYNRDKGYNICPIAGSNHGRKVSTDTRKRISESLKGNIPWNKGKKLTKKHKSNLKRSRNLRVTSEETRKRISESLKGRIPWNKYKEISEEHRTKIKDNYKPRINFRHSEETKNKIRRANVGRKLSEETKKKISKQVLNIDTGEIFNSVSEASRLSKVNLGSISKVCLGCRKTAGGYRWKYLGE